jgi:hypothetical protein
VLRFSDLTTTIVILIPRTLEKDLSSISILAGRHPLQLQCRDLQFRANSRNSKSRASIVFHSPNPIPHFGHISKYTNSPSVSAPNKKFGATLQVEHTNITAPLRAFIPDK